jgi:hypothetical protein
MSDSLRPEFLAQLQLNGVRIIRSRYNPVLKKLKSVRFIKSRNSDKADPES